MTLAAILYNTLFHVYTQIPRCREHSGFLEILIAITLLGCWYVLSCKKSQMLVPALPFNPFFLTKCRTGNGRISACGGDGFAGGGGGRVSVDIFSRHDEPEIFAYGRAIYLACLRIF